MNSRTSRFAHPRGDYGDDQSDRSQTDKPGEQELDEASIEILNCLLGMSGGMNLFPHDPFDNVSTPGSCPSRRLNWLTALGETDSAADANTEAYDDVHPDDLYEGASLDSRLELYMFGSKDPHSKVDESYDSWELPPSHPMRPSLRAPGEPGFMLNTNWHERIQWAYRCALPKYNASRSLNVLGSDEEQTLLLEIGRFSRASCRGAATLVLSLIQNGFDTSPEDFIEVTDSDPPMVQRFYQKKFADDRQFVRDGVVYTVVLGQSSGASAVRYTVAKKLYSNDQKGKQALCEAMYSRGAHDAFAIPAQCIVDFLGIRVVTEPLVPLGNSPPIDLVPDMLQDCRDPRGDVAADIASSLFASAELFEPLKTLSSYLRLCSWPVPFEASDISGATGGAVLCEGAGANIQRCDGALHIRQTHEVLPPILEAQAMLDPLYSKRYRPEFCYAYDGHLKSTLRSPVVFSDGLEGDMFGSAFQRLQVVVEDCVGRCNGVADSWDLQQVFQSFGVNMRYLGMAYERAVYAGLKNLLAADMVARAVKHLWDAQLQAFFAGPAAGCELMMRRLIRMVNDVFGLFAESSDFWSQCVIPEVARHFNLAPAPSRSPGVAALTAAGAVPKGQRGAPEAGAAPDEGGRPALRQEQPAPGRRPGAGHEYLGAGGVPPARVAAGRGGLPVRPGVRLQRAAVLRQLPAAGHGHEPALPGGVPGAAGPADAREAADPDGLRVPAPPLLRRGAAVRGARGPRRAAAVLQAAGGAAAGAAVPLPDGSRLRGRGGLRGAAAGGGGVRELRGAAGAAAAGVHGLRRVAAPRLQGVRVVCDPGPRRDAGHLRHGAVRVAAGGGGVAAEPLRKRARARHRRHQDAARGGPPLQRLQPAAVHRVQPDVALRGVPAAQRLVRGGVPALDGDAAHPGGGVRVALGGVPAGAVGCGQLLHPLLYLSSSDRVIEAMLDRGGLRGSLLLEEFVIAGNCAYRLAHCNNALGLYKSLYERLCAIVARCRREVAEYVRGVYPAMDVQPLESLSRLNRRDLSAALPSIDLSADALLCEMVAECDRYHGKLLLVIRNLLTLKVLSLPSAESMAIAQRLYNAYVSQVSDDYIFKMCVGADVGAPAGASAGADAVEAGGGASQAVSMYGGNLERHPERFSTSVSIRKNSVPHRGHELRSIEELLLKTPSLSVGAVCEACRAALEGSSDSPADWFDQVFELKATSSGYSEGSLALGLDMLRHFLTQSKRLIILGHVASLSGVPVDGTMTFWGLRRALESAMGH
ncbi:apicomplexan-conserved protein [Babesia caballi]|uniref:Apicomplexan-conserved protein n=1 Tax=Babesia caballi TaxID=5871 RepID=A0AAV4LSD2_BABCB|nr:apicomplexan-conserved protein [Babesia caballi]